MGEVATLQALLIQKEKEIGEWEKSYIKQEKKCQQLQMEQQTLNEQLKLSSNENKLKSLINELQDKLTKQSNLSRLQSGQILEFEQKLWQASKQRDEAESQVSDLKGNQSAPTAGGEQDDQVAALNQDLRVRHVQIRDLQEKVEMYQGSAPTINSFSRQQLVNLHDELTQSLFNVDVAMKNTVKK